MQLQGTSVLVLGLGESGLAMALWLARCGAKVRVADSRSQAPGVAQVQAAAPDAEVVLAPFSPALLDGMQLLAISPGLSPQEEVVLEARRRGIPITGEIELFAQALRDLGWKERCKVIAITGTNGKTTTTTLGGALGRAAGLTTEVAGNISPAALSALMACLDAGRVPALWVLELSSFQLETLDTLAPDAATVLNVTDDHLDRHGDLDGYALAKARIFDGAQVQVLNRDDGRVMAMARSEAYISFGLNTPPRPQDFGLLEQNGQRYLAQGDTALLAVADLPLVGLHNAANALAALALGQAVGLPMEAMLAALRQFKGLAHRVEWVADVAGVACYDDSKGTNVGATVAALDGLGRKVGLIAGGDGKGQDFSPLKDAVARHGRFVALIGRDAPLIEAALAGCGVPMQRVADMDVAVQTAFAACQPGDALLLSPACASWDMYRNYAHRAEVFIAAVKQLPGQELSA